MKKAQLDFLRALVETPSPSGYEEEAQKLFRSYVKKFCHDVQTDVMGNCYGILNPKARPRVMLAGHCDQIGFIVHYVTDDGFLYFRPVGGVDPTVAVSQRVRIKGKSGMVDGVIGRKAIHLMDEEDRKRVPKIEDMWVDIGAKSKAEALKLVSLGDVGVFTQPMVELQNNRVVAMAFDNKMGTWIVAEALRILSEQKIACCVYGVSTVQEEIGLRGARSSAYFSDAEIGIATDVTHGTDNPGIDKKKHGEVKIEGGPVICRGANINPKVFDRLQRVAKAKKIPYQVEAAAGGTGTDANVMQMSKGGMATGLVSVPLRYMHTPCELLSLEDLDNAAKLMAAFCASVTPKDNWIPGI